MVAVGAAGNDPATCVYHQDDFFGGITVSSFMFGGIWRGSDPLVLSDAPRGDGSQFLPRQSYLRTETTLSLLVF